MLNREPDTEKHIQNVLSNFPNAHSPEVCKEIIACIIRIRREEELAKNTKRFFKLVRNNHSYVARFNSRWLISVLDTFVDHSPTEGERNAAMAAATMVNMVKMWQTSLDLHGRSREAIDPDTLQNYQTRPAWDGMHTMNVMEGDLLINMLQRMDKVTQASKEVSMIWRTLLAGLNRTDNPYSLMFIHRGLPTY